MPLVRLLSSQRPSPVHSPARGGAPGDEIQGNYSLQMADPKRSVNEVGYYISSN